MELGLAGKTALVTGGSKGIGLETARALAREGVKVLICARRETALADAAHDIMATTQAKIETHSLDVTKVEQIEKIPRIVGEKLGRIDILVNNVAISDNKHIFDITEEEWDRVLAVTLKSQFLMGKHVGQQMATQGGGRIVNIGSTSGFTGRSRAIAYSAAKGGVANLTRAMAVQLAPHKVRVNAIVPNKIGSPVGKDEFDASRPVPNMAKRPGEPVEAAKAVLFLVTDDSSFVWGANLFVDGGVSAMDLS